MVEHYVEALQIKTPSSEATIANLSGGNQQKVLFARSMAAKPVVFLADEPTRGVDAGARIELYKIVRDIAKSGAGVVVLSSDAVELSGLCDRVLVFSRGKIIKSLTGDELTEENDHRRCDRRANGAPKERRNSFRAAAAFPFRRLCSGARAHRIDHRPWPLYDNVNDKFLSPRSLNGMLFPCQRAGLCQCRTVDRALTGGIDLSVGP